MFNETIFLDKIINYLDNQFFNCTSNIKENIFEIESILYFKEKYSVSTGLDKENYKSIYYFIFEEYIDKLLLPLNNKIKNSMKEKRFKVPEFNNLISLEELELALNQQVNIKKDLKILASTILNTEINDLYLEKWKFIQKISKKIFGLSYLEIYKEYYGDIIENIYQQKKEVLELIKRKISTQPKVIIQADLKIESIIKRIEDETKKLGLVCNFRDITQKLEKDKFTMYYSYKKDKILVELKLPRNYEDLLKIWHEYGHVVHYQNMDKSLPFALMKLNNLHNMEGVALYYQFMCNDSNKQAYDFKIYEMLWWTFIEFFSIYEWLDFNMKKNINDIFVNNLKMVFEKVPTYPCPIRYFHKGFKSFRYILGLFLACNLKQIFYEDPQKFENILKDIMFHGGINNNSDLIYKGLKNTLKQTIERH